MDKISVILSDGKVALIDMWSYWIEGQKEKVKDDYSLWEHKIRESQEKELPLKRQKLLSEFQKAEYKKPLRIESIEILASTNTDHPSILSRNDWQVINESTGGLMKSYLLCELYA